MSDTQTACYLRVSTDAQETKIQRRAILQWLKGRGLTRHDVKWYVDKGQSSVSHMRPMWGGLMTSIRAGNVRRVVVWKLDRANRWGPKEHLRWRLEMDALGVEIVSITEPEAVRFNDLMDVLRETIWAEARAKWLADHRERIRAGVNRSKHRKHWGGARQVDPTRNGMAKLTPDQWRELIDWIVIRKASVSEAAARYGVSRTAVMRHLAKPDVRARYGA